MRKYQLVLQFPSDAEADCDTLDPLETALTAALGEGAEMDGHDVGTDTMNLFIFTDDPQATFKQVKSALEREEQLEWVTAAYHEVDSDRFTVLWPLNWRKEFKFD